MGGTRLDGMIHARSRTRGDADYTSRANFQGNLLACFPFCEDSFGRKRGQYGRVGEWWENGGPGRSW